jgi:hypothetical protein
VHVNVANASATAGGDTLSHLEVLNVYLAWTRFDGVTARFARPWMWREPSMAPMYATGAEFAWHEKAWEQGSSAAPDPATYDIPTFVRAVHAVGRSDGFSALDEPAKRERLFGRAVGTPATAIGRAVAARRDSAAVFTAGLQPAAVHQPLGASPATPPALRRGDR